MGVLFVGGLLIGIFLGRIFKVLVIVPAGCLGIFLVCIRSLEVGDNLAIIVGEAVVLMTSLQIGYVLAVLSKNAPKEISSQILESRVKTMQTNSIAASSAQIHRDGRK